MTFARARKPTCQQACHWLRPTLAAGLLLALLGCASERPDPTPLKDITPKIAGRQVWSAQVPAAAFTLQVAVHDSRIALAGSDGSVQVLDAQDGKLQWSAQLNSKLSAGVGSDGRRVAVVTQDNQVVVLEDGRELWRKGLSASVTTAPLVAGERVFVMAVDRSVHAFDALDGRRLWVQRRPGEALTLQQPGVLQPYRNTLLAGHGPRLTALDPLTGELRWDVAVAVTRGTNEVERLSDLVGPVMRKGTLVCTRAFQAGVGCVDADKGSLLWSRPHAGAKGLAGDDKWLVGADANDRITAWKTATGESGWTNETLLYRGLSPAQFLGRAAVFGDMQGHVHFLELDKGEVVLRLPTDGSAIVGQPVVAGSTLVVVTRKGGVFAFRPE